MKITILKALKVSLHELAEREIAALDPAVAQNTIYEVGSRAQNYLAAAAGHLKKSYKR